MFIRSLVPLLCLAVLASASARAATAHEQEQLVLILRQLDNIETLAKTSAAGLPERAGERYRFDYQRLLEDIRRVREGVQGYLTPSRAQPRDLEALAAHYRREPSRQEADR